MLFYLIVYNTGGVARFLTCFDSKIENDSQFHRGSKLRMILKFGA